MLPVPAPIQRMIDATNRGDTPGFLACFTDDASLVDWGREFSGAEGIAKWNQTDNIGKLTHFEVIESSRKDDDVLVTFAVSGAGYNGTGDIVFTLEGDLIRKLIIS